MVRRENILALPTSDWFIVRILYNIDVLGLLLVSSLPPLARSGSTPAEGLSQWCVGRGNIPGSGVNGVRVRAHGSALFFTARVTFIGVWALCLQDQSGSSGFGYSVFATRPLPAASAPASPHLPGQARATFVCLMIIYLPGKARVNKFKSLIKGGRTYK